MVNNRKRKKGVINNADCIEFMKKFNIATPAPFCYNVKENIRMNDLG